MAGSIESMKSVDMKMEQMMRICSGSIPVVEKQIQELCRKPKVKISGHLVKSTTRGYVRWIRVLEPEESKSGKRERIYLGRSEQGMVQQLAYKLWLEAAIQVRKGQLGAMKTFLRRMNRISRYSVRIVQDPGILDVLGMIKPVKDELAVWQKADFQRNPQHPEALRIHAESGLMVRSKSEAIIVNELVRMNIPFRYECELKMQNYSVYPDFTIRHPVTGETFVWEHFGLMDDPIYAANAGRKIEEYIRIGYIPMVNLILTGETKEHPLDYGIVRMLIQYFFEIAA